MKGKVGLKGSKVFIVNDITREAQQRRAKLVPIKKEGKECGF